MKMKKVLALTAFTLLAGLIVSNNDKMVVSASSDGILNANEYYKVEADYKSFDFETDSMDGYGKTHAVNTIRHETANPIAGVGSLSTTSADTGYAMQLFHFNNNTSYRDPGRYFVEFDVKPLRGTSGIVSGVDVTENNGFICDFGVAFVYDENGVAVDYEIKNVGGWNPGGYENGKVTPKGNGVFTCYYEYVITESTAFSGNHSPLIHFKSFATNTDNEVLWDNVKFGKKENTAKYFTYFENNNFNTDSKAELPHHNSVLWGYIESYVNDAGLGDTLTYETDTVLEGNRSAKFEYVNDIANNTQLGGLASEEMTALINKDITISFDIKLEGFSKVTFWNPGTYWTELHITPEGASKNGTIKSLKTSLNNGVCHVEYVTHYDGSAINLNAFGQGYAIIDNFSISYEDYSPYVISSGMDVYGIQMATINYDLKDGEFVSLKCGDIVVDTSLYTLNEETRTITLPLSSYDEAAKSYTLVSSLGETTFDVNAIDTRTVLSTATYTNETALSKVYDGTTNIDLSNGQMTLSGVALEDEVSLAYTAALESANVGDAVKVLFTDFALTGADAGKYKLADDFTVAEYTVKVSPKQLTVASYDLTKEKVYDGSTSASIGNVVLEGVVGNDVVNVTAVASYDKASIDASSINISYTIDNANYLAPVADEVNENVKINKKDVTVTVDSATIDEGEADPTFTSNVEGLVGTDTLIITYSRDEGNGVGTYAIKAEVTANDVSKNYNITVVNGTLTINEVKDEQPSVEPSVSETPSEIPSVNPSTPADDPVEEPVKKGCKGSTAASFVSLLTIIGAMFLKKRK